jgi:hypothetical protein
VCRELKKAEKLSTIVARLKCPFAKDSVCVYTLYYCYCFFVTSRVHHVLRGIFGPRRDEVMGKPDGKRPLGRPRRRYVDNIKMDLGETGWGCVDWIGLRIGISGELL